MEILQLSGAQLGGCWLNLTLSLSSLAVGKSVQGHPFHSAEIQHGPVVRVCVYGASPPCEPQDHGLASGAVGGGSGGIWAEGPRPGD